MVLEAFSEVIPGYRKGVTRSGFYVRIESIAVVRESVGGPLYRSMIN